MPKMPDSFLQNFSGMAWQKLTNSYPTLQQGENCLEYSLIYECLGRRCRLTKKQSKLLLDDWATEGRIRKNCRGIYYLEHPGVEAGK